MGMVEWRVRSVEWEEKRPGEFGTMPGWLGKS